MFTIKFYSDAGRRKIMSAESFTILRGDDGGSEITLHQKDASYDSRIDIADSHLKRESGWPMVYDRAIIENMAGKTTEIIGLSPKGAEIKPTDLGVRSSKASIRS